MTTAQWKPEPCQNIKASSAIMRLDWNGMTYNEITNLFRVASICSRIKNLRHATKLWNAIDNMDTPGPLWGIMLLLLPWAFIHGGNPNSIMFTY